MYFVSPSAARPSSFAAGSHTKPTSTVTNAAIKFHPATGTTRRLLSGDTTDSTPKYAAESGIVNTSAPSETVTFAATKQSAPHRPLFFSNFR